jgi:hypothetical protein
MTTLDALLNWVQGREQLLSGLAALVVLIGVIVSPLGAAAGNPRTGRNPPRRIPPSSWIAHPLPCCPSTICPTTATSPSPPTA